MARIDTEKINALSPGAQHNLSYLLFMYCEHGDLYLVSLRHEFGLDELLDSGIVNYEVMPQKDFFNSLGRNDLNKELEKAGITGFKKNMSRANLVAWIEANHPDFVNQIPNTLKYYSLVPGALVDPNAALRLLDGRYERGQFDMFIALADSSEDNDEDENDQSIRNAISKARVSYEDAALLEDLSHMFKDGIVPDDFDLEQYKKGLEKEAKKLPFYVLGCIVLLGLGIYVLYSILFR